MSKRKLILNPEARRTVIAWSIIATILFGPYLVWNVGNLFGLYPDVLEIFAKNNVHTVGLYCAMDGMSREAKCTFYASDAEVQKLIVGLKLEKLSHDSRDKDCDCSVRDLLTGHKQIESYGVYGRPKELHLESGRAFSHLVLHRYPGTNETCIDVCYAYG